ncbi:MAG: hypothetical protein A3C85_03790 [Candidatus Doudnabacteria bacterium RIFCSPHIGHO2_02_FULL_48_21]|uniref:Uncharacterized protein n=1 Tax=Candidatus Doudnabacteria bacterium RIFCSPLOWO2_02_FULL_48_13 TaxID=1817845 RepID=A0A1F5QD37_9BACT|nr:MAG: hypothetical protein A3K05_03285 [Candidatus Doudnabacteria bacterium RIFCSPHIGHO2_01_48_18]OGE91764.1 MAG: hypothetical protein A3F44_00130 [Candidatus Doudnabacteria bacterium RIFCSPHIGHO2_12_FULL_47_25]OGE93577.1 MAG: hypothetical protein A3C85_03790 [Candidatus Doudnabacteria bacterium RIFCSPHIGHO2_02_FULL_48_21]OGE99680.1 MAG: hypothetical protein A3J05_00610 [Candidatus Doudnabacteria bacterium RIFCSPLOWO2_02_FULL_48_13]OGF01761.1 MAG: hypothetical protein A3G07_01535 [Candidatus 
MSKRIKIIAGIIGVAAAIFGLLAYYQSQGILKIFPSREDRRIEQILTIDRSKFGKPEGLPDEKFEEEIAKLADLKKQIEQKPDDPTLWFAFAFTKDFLNDHEGSVAAWEKSFELQPLDFRTPVNMANVYQYFLKDYKKAEFYYREGLKLKADYTIAYQGLADLYRFNWKEKQNLFEPLMEEAIQKDPANKASYLVGLIEYFVRGGDLTRGQALFNELKTLDPKEASELKTDYPQLQ